jgi:hypothetical protein
MEQSPSSETKIVTQLVKKYPAFYYHMSPPLVPVLIQMHPQSTLSYPIYLRSILILFSHLRLGLPSGFQFFQTKILYTFPIYHTRATFPTHLILLDLITLITFGVSYKLWSPSLCSHLQPSTGFSCFGPNILLSTLFSNTGKLRIIRGFHGAELKSWISG